MEHMEELVHSMEGSMKKMKRSVSTYIQSIVLGKSLIIQFMPTASSANRKVISKHPVS